MDIKDNNDKNILHYLVMSDLKFLATNHLSKIFKSSLHILLTEQDVDVRTPLHHAAMLEKYVFNDFQHWTISHEAQHFMIKDKNNLTVLDILFRKIPSIKPQFGRSTIKLPYN